MEAAVGHTAASGSFMDLREERHGGQRGAEVGGAGTDGMRRRAERAGKRDGLRGRRCEGVNSIGDRLQQRRVGREDVGGGGDD